MVRTGRESVQSCENSNKRGSSRQCRLSLFVNRSIICELIIGIRASHKGSMDDIRVGLVALVPSLEPLHTSNRRVKERDRSNGGAPMVDMDWIALSIAHQVAQGLGVLAKNVVSLHLQC